MKGSVTNRDFYLGLARVAGYHDDGRLLVRALVERKGAASSTAIRAAFAAGARMKVAGVPCSCGSCNAPGEALARYKAAAAAAGSL